MHPQQPPSGPAAELYARVQEAAAGTPYLVTPTADGFDVTVDVAVPQWRNILYRQHARKVFTHRVSLDEREKKLTITDELYELQWSVGVAPGEVPTPRIGGRLSVQSGRVWHISGFKRVGTRADGSVGVVDEYTFSSEEGRRLITDPAKELGWRETLGKEAKIGLAALILLGVGTVVALLVVGIVLLLGS